MSDLFHQVDPTLPVNDPRATVYEKSDVAQPAGRRTVNSVDEILSILGSVIEAQMAPREDVEQWKGSGWVGPDGKTRGPDCHRWRFEDFEVFPNSIIGHQSPGQFRWSCEQRLRSDNLGTGHYTILQVQNNGMWIPVEYATKQGVVGKLDGLRKSRVTLPDRETIMLPDLPEWLESVEVAVDVIHVRIRWVDAKNAPDLMPDGKAAPVPTVVKEDPRLAMALEKLASTGGPTNDMALAVHEMASEMRASRMAAPKGVDTNSPEWKAAVAEIEERLAKRFAPTPAPAGEDPAPRGPAPSNFTKPGGGGR